MNPSTEQRFVIVTGASKGIGRATSLALVKEHGCSVLALGRSAAELNSLYKEAGGRVEVLVLDITSPNAAEQVLHSVAGRRVHGLINNAGLLITKPFGSWTEEDMSRLFRTNVFAPVLLSQALLPALQGEIPGHIVNIGSMGGFQGSAKFQGLLAYSTFNHFT